jgi:hypothetical protein
MGHVLYKNNIYIYLFISLTLIIVTGYTRAVIRTTRRHVTTLATDRLYSHGRRTTLFFSLLSLCKYRNTVYSIVQLTRDNNKESEY